MFAARILQPPTCVFGNGVERTGGDERFKGLRANGPFDGSDVPRAPRIVFVFPTEYTPLANQIYHGLKTGNNQFPGMNALFEVALLKDNVIRASKFSINGMSREQAATAYGQAIHNFIGDEGTADFALVICDKTQHWESPSPYYTSKATLAAAGMPSQIVTTDLLENPNQLTWSLGNIALQIFVKLGGHPWFVKPSPGAGDIVVGVGRSERRDARGSLTRFVGYTTCYTAGGLLKSVEVFKPQNTFQDYLDGLGTSVSQALRRAIGKSKQPARLVLHVPKTFSRVERERVEAALDGIEHDAAIQYVVLRVNDEHPFLLFDPAHQTMAPQSGISVELDSRNRILLLEGRPASGNMRVSPPAPLWVTLQAASTSETHIDTLVQQVYELSVANWRGFNAKARPITTHYSKLIADILSATEGNDIVNAIAANERLRNVPWFI